MLFTLLACSKSASSLTLPLTTDLQTGRVRPAPLPIYHDRFRTVCTPNLSSRPVRVRRSMLHALCHQSKMSVHVQYGDGQAAVILCTPSSMSLSSYAGTMVLRALACGGYVNKPFLPGISGSMVSLLVRHLHSTRLFPLAYRDVDEYCSTVIRRHAGWDPGRPVAGHGLASFMPRRVLEPGPRLDKHTRTRHYSCVFVGAKFPKHDLLHMSHNLPSLN